MDNDNRLEIESANEKTARLLSSYSPIILRKAIIVLQERLRQDSKNGKLWFQLGNAQRGLGELKAASHAFKQAVNLNHQPNLSRYLGAICSQIPTKINYPSSPLTPTPFIRRFDLLTEAEINIAWQIIKEHNNTFKTSLVGKNQIRKTTRDSITLSGRKFKSLRDLFKERISPVVEQAFATFDIKPPKKQRYDVQMTSHADGEFYRTHKDSGTTHARVLSYVYYFNQYPKTFSGGELQLFDTNTKLDIAGTTMTSIEPRHNSLIVFPSNYYHQVCTVNLSNFDRVWGRQTINGWLVDAEQQMQIDSKLRL